MTENTMATSLEEEGSSKKTLLVAGGVVGALALGAAGYLLLSGGGSSSEDAFVVPQHKVVAKPKAVKPLATVKTKAVQLPAASAVKIGRDPFSALYLVPVAAPAGTATVPTATATPTTAPTTTTPGTTTGARYTIVLTKVTTDKGGAKLFTFTIGTTSKTVLPAQRFGKYGELVVLTYVTNAKGAVTGAVLQVGDDNPITVPIGVKTSVL